MYIDINLSKEIEYFQKKYLYKIEIISEPQFVIPEYKIELLNKSKKVINKIENINKILNSVTKLNNNYDKLVKNNKKSQNVSSKIHKDKDLDKKISKPRTLWTRRKKAS